MAASKAGTTYWLTGLSGSGKSSVAEHLRLNLTAAGRPVEVLDGDVVRTHLSQGLGFSKEDRDTNVRRIGWVAEVLNRHGVDVIVAAISPYRAGRDGVRARLTHMLEIFCDAPLEVLIARDVKGLYARALAGEIKQFTGVDDPYEPPLQPEVHLHTDRGDAAQGAAAILHRARALGLLDALKKS